MATVVSFVARSVRLQVAIVIAIMYTLSLTRGFPPGIETVAGPRPLLFVIAVIATAALFAVGFSKRHAGLWFWSLRVLLTIAYLVASLILPLQVWGIITAVILALASALGRDRKGADRFHIVIVASIVLVVMSAYFAYGEAQVWNTWTTPLGMSTVPAIIYSILVILTQAFGRRVEEIEDEDDEAHGGGHGHGHAAPAEPTAPALPDPAAPSSPRFRFRLPQGRSAPKEWYDM
jgi:hypothetical protein